MSEVLYFIKVLYTEIQSVFSTVENFLFLSFSTWLHFLRNQILEGVTPEAAEGLMMAPISRSAI